MRRPLPRRFGAEPVTENRSPSITVALSILKVDMAARSSLDRQFVALLKPNSHRTRTEQVQNEEYFSVRTERATIMLGTQKYGTRATKAGFDSP
jgi:hypothetical protein